jgi:hypothetical protein
VKVVHRNEEQAPKHWKQRCLCGSCSSTLEVEETDLSRYHGSDTRGDAWDYVVFVCPVCGKLGTVDVPRLVRERLHRAGDLPPTTTVTAKIIPTRGPLTEEKS